MQELEIIYITNPTSEDFSWRFNGELFTVKKGEKSGFAKPVACHLAKHLSSKMIVDEALNSVTKKEFADAKSPIHVKISQLSSYDTHERRIALYKILGDEKVVIEVLTRYPFKGFIGIMDEYQKFVESVKKPDAKVAELK